MKTFLLSGVCLLSLVATFDARAMGSGSAAQSAEAPKLDPISKSFQRHILYPSQYGGHLVWDPKCSPDPQDAYARGMRMPKSSPKAGECVDNSMNRSAIIIGYEDSVRLGITEGTESFKPGEVRLNNNEVWIANFIHQGKHWVAHLPFAGIKSVILQSEVPRGESKAFHNQIRFIYDDNVPGARLYPQRLKDARSYRADDPESPYNKPIFVKEVIVSSLGLRPMSLKGTRFNKKYGFNGSYAASQGFLSYEDNKKELLEIQDDLVQWQLDMTAEERGQLLRFYAERADHIAETRTYHLLLQNCIVEAFLGIDAVRAYTHPWILRFWRNFLTLEYDPSMVKPNLRKRDLIGPGDSSRLPNTSEEESWGWPVR